jgi:hypothetical protein
MVPEVWGHIIAVLGLAVLCGLWVVLQLSAGEKACGADGECGACASKKKPSRDGVRSNISTS